MIDKRKKPPSTISKAKTTEIFTNIAKLIEETRQRVAVTINKGMVLLYWNIGKMIKNEIIKSKRAEYGKKIIQSLSSKLTDHYGKGFSEKNLWHMVKFYDSYKTLSAVRRELEGLSWSHIKSIIYLDNKLKRQFYATLCVKEHWSTRTLQERINSMLYERTALSKKPEKTIINQLKELKEKDKMTPELVFRDPYVLDFLELSDTYSEKDLEKAILNALEKFILEFGKDFYFVARQKRITIDNEDFYIDLMFYHRKLRCFIVIDLKIGKFKASYKGQMELYLRYLEKYEMEEGENPPIGIILCTDKGKEQIELLFLPNDRIKVSQYLTNLPSKKIFAEKLQKAITLAQIELNNSDNKK